MTDDRDFIEAIQQDPDDDGPRLIYADWLEERGDPKGEFIRVQCALSRHDLDPKVREEFLAREQELLRQHANEWTGVDTETEGIQMTCRQKIEEIVPIQHITWDRGFVEEAHL